MTLYQRLSKNLLFSVISYTGITGSLRLVLGLISQKIIAVYLGPSGLAILANFRNLIAVLTSFSSVGSENGVISQTASLHNKNVYDALINTAITLFFGASLILGILVFWQYEWITMQLHLGAQYGKIVQALIFVIPFMGLTVLMESVLSGIKAFKPIANIQLTTAVFTTFLMICLLYFYGLKGALVALVCRPIFMFFLYGIYFKTSATGNLFFNNFRFELSKLSSLYPFILMTIISVGSVHAVEIGLRVLITDKIGLSSAGLWTAMTTISSNYFVFISAIFSIYVLPRFSENIPSFNLLHESKSIIKILIPFVSLGLVVIYLFRTTLIKLLFTSDFIETAHLFKWQLLADWFRVIFLVFGYYLVAKKRLFDYFIIELFSFSLLITSSLYLIDIHGIEGVVMANTIRYVGCLILVVFLLRKKLFK